jgi:hypothetical protein
VLEPQQERERSLMTIYMITRRHETETGNGSVYDEFIDEDLGYFTSKEKAEEKLADLWKEEASAWERQWRFSSLDPWAARQAESDRIKIHNDILRANGIEEGQLSPLPHVWSKPVLPEWNRRQSDFEVIEIQEGAV